MEFAERYVRASGPAGRRRGNGRGQADVLAAAAFASEGAGSDLGAWLVHVKYLHALDAVGGDAHARHQLAPALAHLLRLWIAEVTRHGRARRWVAEATPWDAHAARRLYRTIAEHALAHWLAPRCAACAGTGRVAARRCDPCAGQGVAPLACRGGFVRARVADMVGELQRSADRHARRAARQLKDS